MKEANRSSRRIFLEIITAGTLGISLSAGIIKESLAGNISHTELVNSYLLIFLKSFNQSPVLKPTGIY
jgi:hypothetical protein